MNSFAKLARQLAASTAVMSVDPRNFNDSIALQTDWIPLNGGGTNFQSAKLHKISDTRWEFRCSGTMRLISWLFIILGLGVSLVGAKTYPARASGSWNHDFLFMVGMGIAFLLAGSLMLRGHSVPAIFDKNLGHFAKTRRKHPEEIELGEPKNFARLERIHALQLLAQTCPGSDGDSYLSYELNLILDDAFRLNVIGHGDYPSIREDARKLASFLSKPVWDSISPS